MSHHSNASDPAVGNYNDVDSKKGFLGRAVDSFKPPVDQKGFLPDRITDADRARVHVRPVSDPEKGTSSSGDAEKDRATGVVSDDFDDNGGLKRALHGRHLQVSLLSLYPLGFLFGHGSWTDAFLFNYA